MNELNQHIDEGYIKFNCAWEEKSIPVSIPAEIKFWRDEMYRLKLIGHYEDINVGYGNISIMTSKGMLVSGTQTGQVYPIQDQHFTLVDQYDIGKNWVHCIGPVQASSESMTHIAIYEADQSIKAIIHIHNKILWNKLMDKVPTTNKRVPYGTPEMALEIKRLFIESNVLNKKIIVMGGHDEGIITFGKNMKQAGDIILKYTSARMQN